MSFRRWLFPSGYRAANHYNRGTLACRSGDWISAETHLREAVRVWQDYPDAWHNLGIALAGQGRFEDAIQAYETALSQRRYFAEAWNSYGGSLAKVGRLDHASKAFTESLRLKPSYQKARENLESLNEITERPSGVFENQQPAPPEAVRRLSRGWLLTGVFASLVALLALTQGPGIVDSLTDSTETQPRQTLPVQTGRPWYCDDLCQVQRDKEQQAYDEGYREGLHDASCETPRPGRFLPIGRDCVNDR